MVWAAPLVVHYLANLQSVHGLRCFDNVARTRSISECSVLALCLVNISIGACGWRLGVVASVVRRTNEVTLRRARLVLGWVTVFGRVYHHGV